MGGKKGQVAWNKGLKGLQPWMNISGFKPGWNKGVKMPQLTGEKNGFFGKHHSDKTKKILSKANKGKRTGEKSPVWMGGRLIHTNGYVLKRSSNHPNAFSNGYVYEHRLVLEQKLGRYLKNEEHTHHINGVKTDNRIENLMLFASNSEHRKFHNDSGQSGGNNS